MEIEALISSYSYIGIFLLMMLNGIVNFPSSQILYLVTGFFISRGDLLFLPVVIVGAVGNTIGNIIAFLLVKKYGEDFARKILMIDKATFEKVYHPLHNNLKDKGLFWIFVGKIIPSIKAFVPVVSGLAKTKTLSTAIIFFFASLIWAFALNGIGFYFGESFSFEYFYAISFFIAVVVVFIFYKKVLKRKV